MKTIILIAIIMILPLTSCRQSDDLENIRIVFLHHSTGENIWNGNRSTPLSKIIEKISVRLSYKFYKKAAIPKLLKKFNKDFNKNYIINERVFPKKSPYGWNNYPYDYYNIWVKNAGNTPFMDEPTLEMLSKEYQIIIFKHCFPVSNIQADRDSSEINSDFKSLRNYKLQYLALRDKLLEFPDTKFILFTGAAQVKSQISEIEAKRAKEFFDWVVNEWDLPDDNIFIWDFFYLQTNGEFYFKDNYAQSINNSHPNEDFSGYASGLLFNRIIDVIDYNGSNTTLIGEKI
ncbi:MAG: hypothetical protein IMY71_07165 [Bacteroidetes bacterium]|nr:hypothetical protein [Bacteroidota bacterium]